MAFKSKVIAWYLSDNCLQRQRQWRDRAARITRDQSLTLYYEAGDPHSYLCAQLLPVLQQHIETPIRICVVPETDALHYPEPEKQRQYALHDAKQLAQAYGLTWPKKVAVPDVAARFEVSRLLLAAEGLENFCKLQDELTPLLWQNDLAAIQAAGNEAKAVLPTRAARQLQANKRRRRAKGHYLPAMWHFRGEWFWGLDRLDLLIDRLQQAALWPADVLHADVLSADYSQMHMLAGLTIDTPLEFYFSFRSPYSYLAAVQLLALSKQYALNLRIWPVLPMAMRGHPVPKAKRLYIAQDAARRARLQNIPFGSIADPIGRGAERALAAFPHDASSHKQLAYCVAVAEQSWAKGGDIAKDTPLQSAIESVGICNASTVRPAFLA